MYIFPPHLYQAQAIFQQVVCCSFSFCLFSFPVSFSPPISVDSVFILVPRCVSVNLCCLQLCKWSTGWYCVYIGVHYYDVFLSCGIRCQSRWSFTIPWSWCHLSVYLNVFVFLYWYEVQYCRSNGPYTHTMISNFCCHWKSFFMHKRKRQESVYTFTHTNTHVYITLALC